jgi:hypothetical protein
MKLGDFLTAINYSKEPILDGDNNPSEREYAPYIINHSLSYFPDTIMQCNQMNSIPGIQKKMHFDYLRLSVRQRKRYSKWLKDEHGMMELLDMLKEVYGYSYKRSKEVLDLLSPEDIEELKKQTYRGGSSRQK